MNTQSIDPGAIGAFLAQFPPFYYLPKVDLDELTAEVGVEQVAAWEYLFEEGEPARDRVFVLWEGDVKIYKEFEKEGQVIDVLRRGDLLGARAVITGKPYVGSARATADSILLTISREHFLHLLVSYPRVAFFFVQGFAAGKPIIHVDKDLTEAGGELHFLSRQPGALLRTDDVLVPLPVEKLLCGPPATTLREAARRMAERRFGSFVIVDDQRRPLGIATESDFIRKGAVGDLTWDDPIELIMSHPVRTIRRGATAAQLIIAMSRYKIDHLVVTEDGTDQTAVTAIISQRDILLAHGNNPAVLVRRLAEAGDVNTLARVRNRADELIYNYLQQEIAIPFISEIVTEINDTLITRAIAMSRGRLAAEGWPEPAVPFCWLALGSEGRKEQLRRTDQDNAIVYADPPAGAAEATARYYRQLGLYVSQILLACGFEKCPADIMASNEKWVQPLQTWKAYFSDWIGLPSPAALLNVSIFFDLRPVEGDTVLTNALSDHIFTMVADRRGFIQLFAQSALEHPAPLSFFRNFILERDTERKDQFDLKARAMRPLDHAARVLVYANDIRQITNTVQRYEALAQKLPDRELFEEAAHAYEILMRYRAINGFRYNDSGRYIYPKQLNKIERETLKTCFSTVERVQQYLKTMFSF